MADSKSNLNKVTLWTRQDIKSLDEIKEKGRYRVKRKYIEQQFEDIAEYYIKLYQWFVDKAGKMVPKPDGVEFPIWCSISEENMLKPIEGTVVYVLEVDEAEVIYFDGRKWDYVLNHLYIPKDEEDEKSYMKDMERKGFKDSFSFIEGKYANFHPLEKKKVMESWMRVFEIEDWNIFDVQANIWEVREDMIKDILYWNGEI
ncbi:DUF3841 domain-containing protein [Tissierella carlieri]|uniref:DUF3841 domain-containing protein n=1 Tax=Tissierella carlieri TaxID=689904 RepID=A0ABT1SAB1_9FIRM|nr:DUF3841 domain-containing protein [Tissierella carlieri]MBU5312843.1 DUF3841 domain-containing protein [Tissierella carlieri]MCQ4923389.1 DUF3841 domain-containing protein [Tissierella carlieri]